MTENISSVNLTLFCFIPVDKKHSFRSFKGRAIPFFHCIFSALSTETKINLVKTVLIPHNTHSLCENIYVNKKSMRLPIVPVEQKPVKSFQLIFPELIAIFIFP